MSKTQDALALVAGGMAPFAAAKQVGLSPNTLYVAIKREREKSASKVRCPCCGTLVPHSQLKESEGRELV